MADTPDQRRLNPRLTPEELAAAPRPFLPELSPVLHDPTSLMTRPCLKWAKRLTLTVESLIVGGGDGSVSLHHPTHELGGSDPIKLDDLNPTDNNTDLNATALAHGLLPRLSGEPDHYLNGMGAWAIPAGGSGGGGATGQWVDLTNGSGVSPELVFDDRGDVILVFVPDIASWTYAAAKL